MIHWLWIILFIFTSYAFIQYSYTVTLYITEAAWRQLFLKLTVIQITSTNLSTTWGLSQLAWKQGYL